MHHHGRDAGVHRHDRLGRSGLLQSWAQNPDQGQGYEVDAAGGEPGRLHRGEKGAYRLPVGNGQKDADHRFATGPCEPVEDVEVQDGFVDGDRDIVLRLEPQGVGQLGVGHVRDLDRPHHDPVAGHPDAHGALAHPGLPPQPADGLGHDVDVDDLPCAHGLGGQSNLAENLQHRTRAGLDVGQAHRARGNVEPYHPLSH